MTSTPMRSGASPGPSLSPSPRRLAIVEDMDDDDVEINVHDGDRFRSPSAHSMPPGSPMVTAHHIRRELAVDFDEERYTPDDVTASASLGSPLIPTPEPPAGREPASSSFPYEPTSTRLNPPAYSAGEVTFGGITVSSAPGALCSTLTDTPTCQAARRPRKRRVHDAPSSPSSSSSSPASWTSLPPLPYPGLPTATSLAPGCLPFLPPGWPLTGHAPGPKSLMPEGWPLPLGMPPAPYLMPMGGPGFPVFPPVPLPGMPALPFPTYTSTSASVPPTTSVTSADDIAPLDLSVPSKKRKSPEVTSAPYVSREVPEDKPSGAEQPLNLANKMVRLSPIPRHEFGSHGNSNDSSNSRYGGCELPAPVAGFLHHPKDQSLLAIPGYSGLMSRVGGVPTAGQVVDNKPKRRRRRRKTAPVEGGHHYVTNEEHSTRDASPHQIAVKAEPRVNTPESSPRPTSTSPAGSLNQSTLSTGSGSSGSHLASDEEVDDFGKKRKFLSADAVNMLKEWYDQHITHPYPDDAAVAELAQRACITPGQIKKWMANKRVRTYNTLSFNGSIHPKKLSKLAQMSDSVASPMTSQAQTPTAPSPLAPCDINTRSANSSAVSASKRSKNSRFLEPQAVDHMTEWYEDHISYPYPTEEEKRSISRQTGLSVSQVTCWFANKRNRNNNTKKISTKQMWQKLNRRMEIYDLLHQAEDQGVDGDVSAGSYYTSSQPNMASIPPQAV